MNRLINENSPYLLQHADNPVDWYPWSKEAFQLAKQQDKPIFLSIGYSTCHWCHVMENESFSDERIGRIMNENFISIKVDREEHPDIDDLYMTAVQAMTGSGGWPLSVFLTPEQKPFYGESYFPPHPAFGHPSFQQVLQTIADMWKHKKDELVETSDKITELLTTLSQQSQPENISENILEDIYRYLESNFDQVHGGFGTNPKFPQPTNLMFLLNYWQKTGQPKALNMVETTLDAMAGGGIRDHIGGGFHRYSTDRKWLVPHFEKMLYDQALLSRIYTQGYQMTDDNDYADIAMEINDYVLRDMTDSRGGFYSGLDADTQGHEGAFYTRSFDEIKNLLPSDEIEIFNEYYGVTETGNYEGKNILHIAKSSEALAHTFKKDKFQIEDILQRCRQKLFHARSKRPRPHCDDKIIVGWNGLMIGSLAYAGAAMNQQRYVTAAEICADFILKNLIHQGRLQRYSRTNKTIGLAVLEDYAFFAMGLLDLYQATFDEHWLSQANNLAQQMIKLFGTETGGAFFQTGSDDEHLIADNKQSYDGPMPSGNSVAALLLLKLGRLLWNDNFSQLGQKVIEVFVSQMKSSPGQFTAMAMAADFLIGPVQEIIICGDQTCNDIKQMLKLANKYFLPKTIIVFHPAGKAGKTIETLNPFLKEYQPIGSKASAFICKNYACQKPIVDTEVFQIELQRLARVMAS